MFTCSSMWGMLEGNWKNKWRRKRRRFHCRSSFSQSTNLFFEQDILLSTWKIQQWLKPYSYPQGAYSLEEEVDKFPEWQNCEERCDMGQTEVQRALQVRRENKIRELGSQGCIIRMHAAGAQNICCTGVAVGGSVGREKMQSHIGAKP